MTVTIGPLTTTFTPPASCTNDFTNYYQMWTGDLGVFDIAGPYTTESCFPSGYNPARSEYYSPGICPAGYKTACSSVDTNGVTAVTCCPPLYSCNAATTYPPQNTLLCSIEYESSTIIYETVISVTDGTTSYSTGTVGKGSGSAMNAYGLQFLIQATDFQSSSSSSVSSTTSTTIESTTTSSSTSSPSTTSSSNSGLTAGAYAGIGVGATIGAIALLAGVFILGRRTTRKRNHGPEKEPDNSQSYALMPSHDNVQRTWELHNDAVTQPVYQLDGVAKYPRQPPHEMGSP